MRKPQRQPHRSRRPYPKSFNLRVPLDVYEFLMIAIIAQAARDAAIRAKSHYNLRAEATVWLRSDEGQRWLAYFGYTAERVEAWLASDRLLLDRRYHKRPDGGTT